MGNGIIYVDGKSGPSRPQRYLAAPVDGSDMLLMRVPRAS